VARGDQVDPRIERRDRLFDQQVEQRRFGGGHRVEVDAPPVVAAIARPAAADRARAVEAAGSIGDRIGRAIVVKRLGSEIDVERRVGRAVARGDQLIGGRGFDRGGGGDRDRPLLAGIEQRVLFDLGADERLEFDVGQRQQLDRLLELDRHDQRLALAKIEAGTQAHDGAPGPRP
jgi:hypothetical protein